jgi:hypothetical protein
MLIRVRTTRGLLGAALSLLFLATSAASAAPTLLIGAADLGGGVWQYDMTLVNSGGSEPLSGLNILAANTLFGLDDTSTITAPSGWDYFAPLPPSVDELNYFSLASADDVAMDDSLGGFSFESSTDPGTIDWSSFEADAIGGTSSTQIPLTTIFTPEPATGLLLAAALAAQAAARRRARQ